MPMFLVFAKFVAFIRAHEYFASLVCVHVLTDYPFMRKSKKKKKKVAPALLWQRQGFSAMGAASACFFAMNLACASSLFARGDRRRHVTCSKWKKLNPRLTWISISWLPRMRNYAVSRINIQSIRLPAVISALMRHCGISCLGKKERKLPLQVNVFAFGFILLNFVPSVGWVTECIGSVVGSVA